VHQEAAVGRLVPADPPTGPADARELLRDDLVARRELDAERREHAVEALVLERDSQPRAAEARPAIRCWCETHTAARAAWSHLPSRTYSSKARSRAAIASSTLPRNQSA